MRVKTELNLDGEDRRGPRHGTVIRSWLLDLTAELRRGRDIESTRRSSSIRAKDADGGRVINPRRADAGDDDVVDGALRKPRPRRLHKSPFARRRLRRPCSDEETLRFFASRHQREKSAPVDLSVSRPAPRSGSGSPRASRVRQRVQRNLFASRLFSHGSSIEAPGNGASFIAVFK